jgi:microcompartment protein CcmK/EutM
MSNLSQMLVRLVIQQVVLFKKEDELSNSLETAQNLKDTVAIDSIGAEYDELADAVIEVSAAETIILDKMVQESAVDFYQN